MNSVVPSPRETQPYNKAGFYLKAVFWLGSYVFNANISFTFQAVKNLSVHLTYLCPGLFCKFLGDFLGVFGVFLKGLVEIMEIKILKIWCCFKLEIEVKNW